MKLLASFFYFVFCIIAGINVFIQLVLSWLLYGFSSLTGDIIISALKFLNKHRY